MFPVSCNFISLVKETPKAYIALWFLCAFSMVRAKYKQNVTKSTWCSWKSLSFFSSEHQESVVEMDLGQKAAICDKLFCNLYSLRLKQICIWPRAGLSPLCPKFLLHPSKAGLWCSNGWQAEGVSKQPRLLPDTPSDSYYYSNKFFQKTNRHAINLLAWALCYLT